MNQEDNKRSAEEAENKPVDQPANEQEVNSTEITDEEVKDESTESPQDQEPQKEKTEDKPTEVVQSTSEDTAEDEDEDDDSDSDDDQDDSENTQDMDYESMAIPELVEAANASLNLTPRESLKRLKQIRLVLDEKLNEDKRNALKAFVNEGNEPEDFQWSLSTVRDGFNDVFKKAREARKEEKVRIEEEKQANLKKKQALLEKLKDLVSKDETEESISEVKEIQKAWKAIRIVPQEYSEKLWEDYTFLMDKFYDNHSINIELKELDRKKNLEAKIELCKKVDELVDHPSLKRSFILLNKYHEEFRNVGPVPREFREEIWNRFKTASDQVRESKKAALEELEKVREENLKKKELLVDKIKLVAEVPYKSHKEWKKKTDEVNALFEEWKKIGPVPASNKEQAWKDFRSMMNRFYDQKSEFFKQLNKERKANLILKEDLCKQAESLLDNEDDNYVKKQLLKLQAEWKEIGPVPEKVNQAVWRRFRKACDSFFNKKKKEFEERKKEEKANLEAKESLIQEVEGLLAESDEKKVFESLKAIQKKWSSTGFVPFKKKKSVNERFDKAVDGVYAKYKKNRDAVKKERLEEHYREMIELPNGDKQIKSDIYKIKKKLNYLQGEVSTWENNIQFFSMSSGNNADKLKADIQKKIDKTNEQINRLKSEIGMMNKLLREQNQPAKDQDQTEKSAKVSEESPEAK
jgi:hypothetical protein